MLKLQHINCFFTAHKPNPNRIVIFRLVAISTKMNLKSHKYRHPYKEKIARPTCLWYSIMGNDTWGRFTVPQPTFLIKK